MSAEAHYLHLLSQLESKEREGRVVEALADCHKMLCLLSGESLRMTASASFRENSVLEHAVRNHMDQLSKQLPLEETVFKACGVDEGFQFQFDRSLDVRSVVTDCLAFNEPLLASNLADPSSQVPCNAPQLSLLTDKSQNTPASSGDSQFSQRGGKNPNRTKKSFSYERSDSRNSHTASSKEEEELEEAISNPFKTASAKLREDERERLRGKRGMSQDSGGSKALGGKRRFNPAASIKEGLKRQKSSHQEEPEEKERHPIFEDERMDSIEERMAELILSEILESNIRIRWEDIAGLQGAKKSVMEIVVYPLWRPELFHGIRRPAKGLLLFGPPGTGKTMIGKAIASEAGATFFNISASSLTSKYVGEGEKMVRALFTVARCYPSDMKVIFIDEVDSLLTQRSENDIEASRRIKTEFLVQMDGAGNDPEERILVVGATNRPQEIDEAARRRFMKRLYIPLPGKTARKQMMQNLLRDQNHGLSDNDLEDMAAKTKGYSGSDVAGLCSEAAFGPIRSLNEDIRNVDASKVRPISRQDFEDALLGIRASVSDKDLDLYAEWNTQFGSFGDPPTGD